MRWSRPPTVGGLAHVFTSGGAGSLLGRKATSLEVLLDTASFVAALAEADAG
jgi:hypothetical protein